MKEDAISGRPGQALVPNDWLTEGLNGQSPYVRLTYGDKAIVVKAVASGVPNSTALIVTPGTFGLEDKTVANVSTVAMSTADYRRNWLLHTCAGRIAVLGLFLVLVGQAVQVSLDLGTHWTLIDVGSAGVSLLNVAKDVLTFGGAALALWQVVINS